ncbi:hypothetical protein DL93DRAFT_2103067 [Clavulina sp. PMI_390]|nr:hypothetical protein DL93DRAFT_2103067 [Clavulina sp. PMI_390]
MTDVGVLCSVHLAYGSTREPADACKESQTQALSSPASSLRSILSTPSPILIPISNYVDEFPSLKEASIASVEGYRQQSGPIAHRFVTTERGVSLLKFLKASGETRTNNRASLAGTKQHPPSLADLNRLLRIIGEELQTHSIWPLIFLKRRAVLFFCSLVEQHLAATESGWFVHGTRNVQHIGMGNVIRGKVFARYWDGNHPTTRSRNPSTNVVQRSTQSTLSITSGSGNTVGVSMPKLQISDEDQGPSLSAEDHSSDTIESNPPILVEMSFLLLPLYPLRPPYQPHLLRLHCSYNKQQNHWLWSSAIPGAAPNEANEQIVGLFLLRAPEYQAHPAETQRRLALAQLDMPNNTKLRHNDIESHTTISWSRLAQGENSLALEQMLEGVQLAENGARHFGPDRPNGHPRVNTFETGLEWCETSMDGLGLRQESDLDIFCLPEEWRNMLGELGDVWISYVYITEKV